MRMADTRHRSAARIGSDRLYGLHSDTLRLHKANPQGAVGKKTRLALQTHSDCNKKGAAAMVRRRGAEVLQAPWGSNFIQNTQAHPNFDPR